MELQRRAEGGVAAAVKEGAKRLLRRTGKGAAAVALHYSGARALLASIQRRAAGGRRVLILSYHRVVGDFEAEALRAMPTMNISQASFRGQLEQLSSTHQVVSLDEALAGLRGEKRALRDLAVVTFDDGYRDVYDHAFPVMRELGMTGVAYVPSGFIGTRKRLGHDRLWSALSRLRERALPLSALGVGPDHERVLCEAEQRCAHPGAMIEQIIASRSTPEVYRLAEALEDKLGLRGVEPPDGQLAMSWEMLRELAAAGWEIGGHTAEHTVLTNARLDEARREIAECKRVIEENVRRPVRHFAYCNGWYSKGVAGALRAEGFVSAVTTEDLPNVPGVDPFALKRKVLWEGSSLGILGRYSPALAACQLDDVFGLLALRKPVPGMRPEPRLDAPQATTLSAHG